MDEDDHRIVRRLKRRDERAFTEFVGQYQTQVYGLVYRLLGNRAEAEDLTQEVFVTVFKSIHRFRGDSSLRTWLLKIARNHARSRMRYRRSRHYKSHDSLESVETSHASAHNRTAQPDDRLVADELAEIARTTFLLLTTEAREILTLRDLNGLKYSDIAEILDIQPGTVRSRLFRARREWHIAIHGSFTDAEDSNDT